MVTGKLTLLFMVTLGLLLVASEDIDGPSSRDASVDPELMKKWLVCVHFYDFNDDNSLNKKDYDDLKVFIDARSDLSAAKKKQLKKLGAGIDAAVVKFASAASVTIQNVIDAFRSLLETNKFADAKTSYEGDVFDLLDTDKDGNISLDDYLLFGEALGHFGDQHQTEAFQWMDSDNDGKVSRNRFIKSYIAYFTDPNLRLDDFHPYSL